MATELELKTVLISDEVDEQCIEILKRSGIEAVKQTKLTKDQLKAEISKYDGLIVRSATKVTADVIEAGTRLKIIGRAGTGVDNVDVQAATKRGIIVMNTPGGNTLSAAEHTCAMLMAVSRHVAQGTACVRAGQWEQKKFLIGNELFGKTLAIIGLGKIGREVAHRMQSFGMKTVGFDPLVSADESSKFGVESLGLDDIWPVADYITLHTPLIPQTKYLINSTTLAKCRKGVRIVNCARGGIINEDDLLDALKSGQCGGAGLDVFEQEPPTNTALSQHPLVTSTPHLGASTVEAQSRVAVEIAQQFVELARQTALVGAINADALSRAMNPDTKPWLQLAKSLAKLGRSILTGTLTSASSIRITTQGDTLKTAGAALAAASLTELLVTGNDASPLNIVSAPALAKSSGIEVQTTYEAGDGSPAATMTLAVVLTPGGSGSEQTGGAGQHQTQLQPLNSIKLTGTVVDGKPLWTAVDGATFWQPVSMTGSLLICRCCDSSKAISCLAAVSGQTSELKSRNVDVLSFSSTVATSSGAVWGSFRLSQPDTQLAIKSACSEFVCVNF